MSEVKIERHGAVLMIRLCRPGGINAFAGTLCRDVAEAFDMAAADDDIRAVMTVGEGSTFCVGGDLKKVGGAFEERPSYEIHNSTVLADTGRAPQSQRQMQLDQLGIGHWVNRIFALEKPTVAALNGATAGGGAGLALLHDYRIAAEGINMTMAYLNIGLAPEHGMSFVLPRIVGPRIARDLFMRPNAISARQALELGVVDEVVSPDMLIESALKLATELASRPPHAMMLTKRLLRRSAESTMQQQLEAEYRAAIHCMDLPETREAVARTRARIVDKQY